jgi:hypothetical protein
MAVSEVEMPNPLTCHLCDAAIVWTPRAMETFPPSGEGDHPVIADLGTCACGPYWRRAHRVSPWVAGFDVWEAEVGFSAVQAEAYGLVTISALETAQVWDRIGRPGDAARSIAMARRNAAEAWHFASVAMQEGADGC